MSQLIGSYGSLSTQTYVQPTSSTYAPQIISMGNYLGPGAASLGIDDPSRQRSTAYVLPQQIDLMLGFFDVQGTSLENNSSAALNSSVTLLAPATRSQYPGMTAVGPTTHGSPGHAGPYGMIYDMPVNPQNCLQHAGCNINPSGCCQCTSGPFYSERGSNTYC